MSEKKKSVSVLLCFDTWLKFKIFCAKQDRTISDVMEEIVTKAVSEGGRDE